MNRQVSGYTPQPTPLCAAYAPLLPLLDTDLLSTEEAAATREHMADCLWCQREVAGYDALTFAARRHYGADAPVGVALAPVAPPPSLIFAAGLARDGDEDDDQRRPAEHSAPLPQPMLLRPPRQSAPATATTTVGRPPTTGLRALGAVAAVLLVLLFAGLLLSPFSPLGKGPQSPTPTLAPGADLIVFADVAPWGTLTINGRSEPNPNLLVEPVRLPPGRDTLEYQAAPFPTLRCVISAPAAASDTCLLISQGATQGASRGSAATPDLSPTTPNTRIVDLLITPQRLTPAATTQLVAATQRAFAAYTSTAQVLPGDHYLAANGQIAVATTAFPITLSFVLPTASISNGSDTCAPFCASPGPQLALGDGLHFGSFPVPQWRYTATDGSQVTAQPAQSTGNDIDIAVQWDGTAWQVAISPTMVNSTMCELALAALPTPPGNTGMATECGPSANPPANGAVSIDYTGQSGASHGLILYRAGVVMSANAAAVNLFPTLTVANTHETAIAQQLAAQLPSA